ncbi:MAG: sugar transferase [Psychrobacter sp.]|nr:sugar transferase [Psychrobacter sp.]
MFKRLFDMTTALVALIILSPVLAITAYQVKKHLGSPVLFRQTRPGLHGEPFEMIKFRTMLDAYDEQGNPLPDDARLTPFGKRLRKSSIDELPELWNILKGDMSVVGPRPLFMRYLPYYTEEEERRHDVRPGLTGLAQVSGRNAITWEERLSYDLQYVDDQSFAYDLSIIYRTVGKVFHGNDVLVEAPQGPLDEYRKRLNESQV